MIDEDQTRSATDTYRDRIARARTMLATLAVLLTTKRISGRTRRAGATSATSAR